MSIKMTEPMLEGAAQVDSSQGADRGTMGFTYPASGISGPAPREGRSARDEMYENYRFASTLYPDVFHRNMELALVSYDNVCQYTADISSRINGVLEDVQ